jgi:uncharacterized membrane protein YfcA
MTWEPWQWVVAAIAAILVGVAKTGIAGLGVLFVAIFQSLLPGKQATGFVLPLLIFGDVVAVLSYRRHTRWLTIGRLFPWAAAGVVAGYFALKVMSGHQAQVLTGLIVCAMVGLHVWRRRNSRLVEEGAAAEPGRWLGRLIGILAGFTTQVANAAGPLMGIYLLAMKLPKMEYVGTGAVFFLLLNCYKVPFMIHLGLITPESTRLNLVLAPLVLAGAGLGRWLLKRINQKHFENLVLPLAFVAGLKLLFS